MKMSKVKDFPFGCKGIKTYRGHEGEPLRQATLMYQGKKIGFIGEGDWGGPATLQIDEPYQKIVDDFIKAQPKEKSTIDGIGPLSYPYDRDIFVYDVLTRGEILKKVAAHQKKGGICFYLPEDDDKCSYRCAKNASIAAIMKKYPEATILLTVNLKGEK